MGLVVAAGEGHGAGLAVGAPLERRFAVGVAGGRDVRQLQGGGVVLAFKGDLGGVNRHALFRAGGSSLDSGGNLSSQSLHVGCVIAAGEGHGAGLAVGAPLEGGLAIGMAGGGDVRQLQSVGVGLVPESDLSGVGGDTHLGAGGGGLDGRGDLSVQNFHVACIIAAGEGGGTGLAVVAPPEHRFAIIMADSRDDLPGVDVLDFLGAGFIGKVLAAAGAVPVGLGAVLGAGGSHAGNLFYLVLHGYGDESGGGGAVAQGHGLVGQILEFLSGVGDGEVHILAGLVLVDGAGKLAVIHRLGAVTGQRIGILALALNLGTVQNRDGIPVNDEVGGIDEGVVAHALVLVVGQVSHIQLYIHPVGLQLHVLAEHGHGLGAQGVEVGDRVGIVDVFLDGHLPAGEHAVFGDKAGGLGQLHLSALVIGAAEYILALGNPARQVTAGGVGDGVLLHQPEGHAVLGGGVAGVAVGDAVGLCHPLALALVKGHGNGLGGGVGVVPAVVAGELALIDLFHPVLSLDGGFAGPDTLVVLLRLGEGDGHPAVGHVPTEAAQGDVFHSFVYLGLVAVDGDVEVGAVALAGGFGAGLVTDAGKGQRLCRQLPAALGLVVYGGNHHILCGVLHGQVVLQHGSPVQGHLTGPQAVFVLLGLGYGLEVLLGNGISSEHLGISGLVYRIFVGAGDGHIHPGILLHIQQGFTGYRQGRRGVLNRANQECQPPLGDGTVRLVKVRSHSLSCPGHTIPIENQFIFLDGLSVCQLVTFQTGSR